MITKQKATPFTGLGELTRGQKAVATRKVNQAKEASRLLKEQTPTLAERRSGQAKLEAMLDESAVVDVLVARHEVAAGIAVLALDLAAATADELTKVQTGYSGPMLALRARQKAGVYQRQPNGQPACGDEVANLLGTLEPEQVVRALVVALNLPNNPYAHLNVGQQSMNLRNRLRGAMKRGEFGMGVLREAVEDEQATK